MCPGTRVASVLSSCPHTTCDDVVADRPRPPLAPQRHWRCAGPRTRPPALVRPPPACRRTRNAPQPARTGAGATLTPAPARPPPPTCRRTCSAPQQTHGGAGALLAAAPAHPPSPTCRRACCAPQWLHRGAGATLTVACRMLRQSPADRSPDALAPWLPPGRPLPPNRSPAAPWPLSGHPHRPRPDPSDIFLKNSVHSLHPPHPVRDFWCPN